MKQTIAFIGVGHLAEYMIDGLRKTDQATPIWLLARSKTRALKLWSAGPTTHLADDPQAAIDQADIVVVATRPSDVVTAMEGLRFKAGQTVISVAAGISLASLAKACHPANAVRSLPLSCVSIQKSPTLMYPDNPVASDFFRRLGTVHVLENEDQFPAATALTGALYAWLFALMAETNEWAKASDLPEKVARELVQDTFAGAAAMAQAQTNVNFDDIWASLATPGGISEQGHRVISDQQGFTAFSKALTAVRDRLQSTEPVATPREKT